jgi:endoglucanase
MNHFTSQYGLNVYRLPVCWQYLVNWNLGGSLDQNAFGTYDQLVQACLQTGAYCVIDIHNYARWQGQIINQSGGAVTTDHFTSLWQQM